MAKQDTALPSDRAAGLRPQPATPFSQSSIPSAWQHFSTCPRDRRVLVSCTEEAPYPVMIAMWDGATRKFVSTEKGVSDGSWNIRAWQPLPDPAPVYFCSFCGKGNDSVAVLIAGPSVFICDDCTEVARGIVLEHAQAIEAETAMTAGHGPKDESAVATPCAPDTPPESDR